MNRALVAGDSGEESAAARVRCPSGGIGRLAMLVAIVVAAPGSGPTALAAQSPTPPPAAVARVTPDRPVELELRSGARSVVAGTTVPIAIRLRPNPGWHSYWRYAGDVGSAPSIEWHLPDGLTAAPLRWPAPERIAAPPLASYGYEREVHLLGGIHVPRSARIGSRVTLAGTVSWVVCKVECLAGDVDLGLSLPVAATSVADSAAAAAFAVESARVPERRADWAFRASVDPADSTVIVLRAVARRELPALRVSTGRVHFFVDSAGVLDHAAPPRLRVDPSGGEIELRLARSPYASGVPSHLTGVLAFDGVDAPRVAIEVDAPIVPSSRLAPTAATPDSVGGLLGLLSAALLALLGGTVLNLMPCVLPVLSIKALGLTDAAAQAPAAARRHALIFGAGVLTSMWALLGLLLLLRAAGAEVGWGYQLQSPAAIGGLALLIFAAALNMAGVFELAPIGGRVSGVVGQLPRGAEAFVGGVLVTALATPCSAPFLATAVAFALTSGSVQAFTIFTALGLGLVWPLALVAVSPRLRRWLPKPGAWMVTLRQLLAFPLFATVVWLAWVRGRQAGADSVVQLLGALTVLAFGLWTLGRFGAIVATTRRRWTARAVALAAGMWSVALVVRPTGAPWVADAIPVRASSAPGVPGRENPAALAWQPYSDSALAALRGDGRIVLLDVTADWCLTCKVNELVAFDSKVVRRAVGARGVALMRADWTTRDSTVTRLLGAFGRNSVPFAAVYPRGVAARPIVLPTLLTPSAVTDALERAAAR